MLFSWKACFSPSVQPSLRKAWVKNGGTLTHSASDFRQAKFFFCNGPDDPWLNELLSRSLVVRHASWISKCVQEEFLMPVAPYTLDDDFDQSKIEDTDNNSENINAPLDIGRQYNLRQPQDLLQDMLALYQSTPLASLPAVAFAIKRHPEEPLKIQNTLKRPYAFDDDSYGKIGLPPMKKQRIHPLDLNSNDMIRRNVGSVSSRTTIDVDTQKNAEATEPDYKEPQHVSPEPTSNSIVKVPIQKPDPKNSRNINVEQQKLPELLSLLSKHRSKTTRTRAHGQTNERFARLIKPFNPSSSPTPNTHPPRCTIKAHAHIHTQTQPPEPTLSSIQRPSLESAHTIFWNTARSSYADKGSGPGPLVVSVDDVLRAEAPTVRSTRFIVNAQYLDKQFKCLAF